MTTKLLSLAIVLLSIFTGAMAQSGIQFEHTTWSEIVKKAKTEKKLIFLDAYASWCGPCKSMAKNVFTNEKVGEFFNANFICAKIDMEQGEGPQLKTKFQVPAYPTLLYIDSNQKVVHRTVGGANAESLIAAAKVALDPEQRFATYHDKYLAGTLDSKDMAKYISLLKTAYMPMDEVMGKYLNSLSKEQILEAENWKLLKENANDVNSDVFKLFVKYSNDIAKKYSKAEVQNKYFNAYLSHFENQLRSGETDENIKAEIKTVNTGDKGIDAAIEATYKLMTSFNEQNWNDVSDATLKIINNIELDNSNLLNTVAWEIFENSTDIAVLKKTVAIAEQSVKIYSGPENNDTWAALLHKTGDTEKAIKVQTKALEMAKAEGKNTDSYVKRLDEMKKK